MRWRFWRRRPKPRLEKCATCGKELPKKREHELRGYANDRAEAEMRGWGGGSYVSETYCAKHCPGGCECGCLTPHLG